MKKPIVIAIIVGILIIATAVLLALILTKDEEPTNQNTNTLNQNRVVIRNLNGNTNGSQLSEEDTQKNEAIRVAKIFAERYGTYIGWFSEDDLENTKDVMTSSLIVKVTKDIAVHANTGTTRYQTIALSAAVKSFTLSASSTIDVSVLRNSTENDGSKRSATQGLTVGVQFVDGRWLVNTAQFGAATNTNTL
jgi:hypothetical protein